MAEIEENDLILPCPVQECRNKNKMYRWTHNRCGGRLKLNDKGIVRCIKCGEKGKFVDWPFNCGDHDYKVCSAEGVAHALVIMDQLSNSADKQAFIASTTVKIMQQLIDAQRYERDSKKNLDGEETNESSFQKEEEPLEEEEEDKDKDDDTEEHKHIDMLLEEILECLLEMKKKSNRIDAFINKSKELMTAMHDYIISKHIYWYKNDCDEHDSKVKDILTVCKELQKKGYPNNLFFFIRNMLNPNTQHNEDDYS